MTTPFEEMSEQDLHAFSMTMVDRRERAAKQMKPCPQCGSVQVQLVDWSTPVLRHKCRHCKHKFTSTLE